MGRSITGRETLASIDESARDIRKQVRDLDGRIQHSSAELLRLRQSELEQYSALAKLRLEELAMPGVVEGLDFAERQVQALLESRQDSLATIETRIGEAQEAGQALEALRVERAERVAEAEKALEEAELVAEKALRADPIWVTQAEKTRTAAETARLAEEKATQAEMDRIEKGRPYEKDRVFSYLWKRGYGTSAYRAFPIARWLDSKLARLCGYDRARPNYAMLLAIPVKLREHAEAVKKVADAEEETLRPIEGAASEAAGVPAKQRELEIQKTALAQVDRDIEAAEARFRGLMEEKVAYAGGEDEHSKRAVEILIAEFRQDGMEQLRLQVRATPRPEDDAIFERLVRIEEEKDGLEASLASLQDLLRRNQQRLSEFESMRSQFKAQGFDDSSSYFPDGGTVAVLLGELARGLLNSQGVWRALEGQRRTRRSSSSSGGFGTSFGSPFGSSSGSSHGSSGGGFHGGGFHGGGSIGGGGGFHTGGSVGGGGFRTGGGF